MPEQRCLHCDISEEIMPRYRARPIFENCGKLLEVVGDILNSQPEPSRSLMCQQVRMLFDRFMTEVESGAYKTEPDVIVTPVPGAH